MIIYNVISRFVRPWATFLRGPLINEEIYCVCSLFLEYACIYFYIHLCYVLIIYCLIYVGTFEQQKFLF